VPEKREMFRKPVPVWKTAKIATRGGEVDPLLKEGKITEKTDKGR